MRRGSSLPLGSSSAEPCPPRPPERPPSPAPDRVRERPHLLVLLRGLSFRGTDADQALAEQRKCARAQIALLRTLESAYLVSAAIYTYPTLHTLLLPHLYGTLSLLPTTLLEPRWFDCSAKGCPAAIRRPLSRQRQQCKVRDAVLYTCLGANSSTFAGGVTVTKTGTGDVLSLQRRMFADLLSRSSPLRHGRTVDAALVMRLDVRPLLPDSAAAALLAAAARSPRKIVVAFRIGNHCDWCCSPPCTENGSLAGSNGCHLTPRQLPRVSDAIHWVPSIFFDVLARGLPLNENLNDELDRNRESARLLRDESVPTAHERRNWGWLEYMSTEYADSNPSTCANRLYALANRPTSVTHRSPMCELLPNASLTLSPSPSPGHMHSASRRA